jgi:hypothetical protein
MLLRIKNPFCPRVTAYRKLFRPENGLLGNWNFRSELADFWRMPVDGLTPHPHDGRRDGGATVARGVLRTGTPTEPLSSGVASELLAAGDGASRRKLQ